MDLGIARGSVSKHAEDRPLLSAAQIRRLDDDKVIILPQRQQPILADKIEYHSDPFLRRLWEAQKGAFPYPSLESEAAAAVSDTIETEQARVMALENTVAELKGSAPAGCGILR